MTTGPIVDARPLIERLTDLSLDELQDVGVANEALYRAGLTDGLPVIPPTSARVERMLSGIDPTSYAGLQPLPPGFMTPTPWDVAACAVLAGCEVGALPLILAGLVAVSAPEFNLLGIQTTTGAASTLFVVNGPIIGALGINAAHNSFGPGWRTNASIGRAIRLVLQNVGLAVPGHGDMATQGHPGKYTWLVAENEERNPWPPLHTTFGFDASMSTVTAVGAVGNVEVVLPATTPEALVSTMAISMTVGSAGRGYFGSGQPLVLLPPESAEFLARHGWSRSQFQQALYEQARVPLSWLEQSITDGIRSARVEQGLDPTDDVRAAHSAEDILVVVTGGVGTKATFVPTWGGGTRAVSCIVEAPLTGG